MQRYRLLILAGLLIGIIGCALKPPPWPGRREAKPSPGTALVIFFRPRSPVGAGVSADVQDNAVNLGTLTNGTYFAYHAKPGSHTLMLIIDSIASRSLRLRAGATYYLRGRITRAGQPFRLDLTLVSPQEGEAAVRDLQQLDYGE
jgi:Protein of unknown function (DUF2846)